MKFSANNSTYNNVGDLEITFNKTEIKNLTFASKTVTVELTTKAYVGVWGIDGFEQKSGDTYVTQVTPLISK